MTIFPLLIYWAFTNNINYFGQNINKIVINQEKNAQNQNFCCNKDLKPFYNQNQF